MAETANELRQRAARIKFLAQRTDGQAYHDDMQAAEHLLHQAKELEKNEKAPLPAAAAPSIPTQSMGTRTKTKTQRDKDLAKIHLLAKKAGIREDDVYRDMLEQVTGKRSSGKMSGSEREKVIKYLQKNGDKKGFKYPDRPNTADSNAQMKKIEALLSEAKYPWKYAKSIAKRQCGKEQLEFCDSAELTGVINALIKDARRHGRRLG